MQLSSRPAQSLLVALLSACTLVGPSLLLSLLVDAPPAALGPLICLAAVTASAAGRRQGMGAFSLAGILRIVGGAVSMVAVIQIGADMLAQKPALVDTIPRLEPQTLAASAPVILVWLLALRALRLLARLDEAPDHDARYVSPFRRLAVYLLAQGGVLIALAVLYEPGGPRPIPMSAADGQLASLAVLAYFVLAIMLLGTVRQSLLRQRWVEGDRTVVSSVGPTWAVFVPGTIAAAVVLSLALSTRPAPSVPGASSTTGKFVALVGDRSALLARGSIADLTRLLGPTARTITVTFPLRNVPQLVSAPFRSIHVIYHGPLPHHPVHIAVHPGRGGARGGSAGNSSPLLGLSLSALALLPLALALRRMGVGGALLAGLAALLSRRRARATRTRWGWRAAASRVRASRRIGDRLSPDAAGENEPRYRVVAAYLRVLHEAGDHGMPRRSPQTPDEFGRTLTSRLHSHRPEVGRLTAAFEHARYSRGQVDDEGAAASERAARGVVRALRSLPIERQAGGRPPARLRRT